ncbi:MAG: MobF family relaxase [Candidatus Devosia phytovorans]|uniref:MobF family relaxase n=1 Tax=Candidatus Devosia phytovorans TaxID=3121372 RepID=A0AAJ5VRK1_9HYPH|nr:MobF family relaxase [Devosia sp.]WEK03344.1 MAG: MobF family relaxase [Devosia sp.]
MPSIDYYLDGREGSSLNYYAEANSTAAWWTSNDVETEYFGCTDGQEVDEETFRRLCSGELLDGSMVNHHNRVRRPGYDLHFAPPKSVSVLALLSSPEDQRIIINAHDAAVRRALDYVFHNSLLHARRGHAGRETETARAYVAAIFRELTSRADDPQLHSHCVVPNIAMRQDGTVGALNNEQALDYQHLIGAMYRAELAHGLKRAGYKLVRRKRHFEIAGIPTTVLREFSQRREAIEAAALKAGIDLKDRAAMQRITLATRPDKEHSGNDARLQWQERLKSLSFDLSDVARVTPSDCVTVDSSSLADQAVSSAFENSAVLQRSKMLASVAEGLQCELNADAIEALISKQLPSLVEEISARSQSSAEREYSTRTNIGDEKYIVRSAIAGMGTVSETSEQLIAKALASRPSLSQEQIDAIRHGLNSDRVCLVEGSAGAGKSFGLSAVAEVANAGGKIVYALGPSWSATKTIGRDTGTDAKRTLTLQGFLLRTESGKIELNDDCFIILDEAGMVSTKDMARLLRLVDSAGAKLVLSGDTEQLPPVSAGAPLAILSRAVGSSKMRQIRRQVVPWQRAASMQFAKGLTADALETYNERGHIDWAGSREEAIQALADRYIADKLWDQANTIMPPPTCLVIAAWNEDVLELNRAIRERLRWSDFISEREIMIGTAVRNRDEGRMESATLALTTGDRVVFGETVVLPSRTINNADTATIIDATADNLRVKFDDGQIVAVSIVNLVGTRQPDEPKAPMIKHAFCVTTNFAQGLTVDRAYVAAIRSTNRESMYVGMTRHRHAVQLFVDLSNFPAPKPPKASFPKFLSKEARSQINSAATLTAQKKNFMSRCAAPAKKRNACDSEADLMDWSALTIDEASAAPNPMEQFMQRRERQRLADGARNWTPRTEAGVPSGLYAQIRNDLPRPIANTLTEARAWINLIRQKISTYIARAAEILASRYLNKIGKTEKNTATAKPSTTKPTTPTSTDPEP